MYLAGERGLKRRRFEIGWGSMSKTQSEKPLVAVVTPAYNGAPYIERNLACVQAQTYPNLVHVVLDNASTDDTPDMIQAAQNGPVPIITKRNPELLPQTPNWNAAIAMTPPDAKYVKFMAADDLMRDDCIEKMVDLAESDPEIDFVHAIDVFAGETKPHGLDPSTSVYSGKDYGARYLRGEITWLSATHVFFRVTPDRLDNPFPLDIRPFMDNDFILRDLLDRKMGFVFEPLLFTRYNDETITAQLGGFRAYFLPGFQLLLRHGDKFLDTDELSDMITRKRRQLLRHLLFWQMTGDARNAAITLKGIADAGFNPSAKDYARALLGWPAHKIGKILRENRTKRTDAPQRLEESAFVSANLLPAN